MHRRVLLKNFPVATWDWSAEFWAADVMFWRVRWVKWLIVEPYFRLESLFGEFWHHNVVTTLMISILDSVFQSGDLPEDLKSCSANTDWEFSRKKWSPDVVSRLHGDWEWQIWSNLCAKILYPRSKPQRGYWCQYTMPGALKEDRPFWQLCCFSEIAEVIRSLGHCCVLLYIFPPTGALRAQGIGGGC